MTVASLRASADRLLTSLRAVDAFVAAQRLSTDALVGAWEEPRTFTVGRDADEILSEATRRATMGSLPAEALAGRLGAVVLAWVEANAANTRRSLAPLLEAAETALQPPSVLSRAARARVRHGPPLDALAALAFTGRTGWLDDEPTTAARVDLCLWWAGGDGHSVNLLSRWLLDNPQTFERMVFRRASGTLLDRVLAARALVVAAEGYQPELATRGVFGVLRTLAQHAETRVWIPATIALGRFAAKSADARAWLFRWLESSHIKERRRATCALASMPGPDSWWIESHVDTLISRDDDPWTLAALGPAIPHLLGSRRQLWETLATKLKAEDKPEIWWSATTGLVSARRLGVIDRIGSQLLIEARQRAQSPTTSITDAMLWQTVIRATDFLDDLDPNPADVDLALDRLVDAALRTSPSRVAARVRTAASIIQPTFDALGAPASDDTPSAVAERLLGLESCARAAALGLWRPLLAAAGEEPEAVDRPALLQHMANAASNTLDVETPQFALHRTALRVLGAYLDAEPSGSAIRFVLRAIEQPWLQAPTRRQASRFKKPLGELVARIVAAARPGVHSNDVRAYKRFLAWWCFAAASPEAVTFLARAESAAAEGLGRTARVHADGLRSAIAAGQAREEGAWRPRVEHELDALDASDTALHHTVVAIATALQNAATARSRDDLTRLRLALIELGEATATLSVLLADPARALQVDAEIAWTGDEVRDLVAKTIGALTSDPVDAEALEEKWEAVGGPLLGPVLKRAIRASLRAVRRTASSWGDRTIRQVGPYRLETYLGGGAQGEVWRVAREPVGRLFVMKLLPARTTMLSTPEQNLMRDALATEADLLKRMYHPNVANFVDFGWVEDQPYLVLEWLVGCDLDQYFSARPLTISEIAPVVEDVVNGLVAMHAMGLVHCDLKPGNVFLRLPLPPDAAQFDAARHRDPTVTPVLGAVVIDFGVARTLVSAGAGPDVISGTPGYLAPEQTRGEVHPHTDVYALAGTIHRALTGQTFFDGIKELGARLIAHGSHSPYEDAATKAALQERASPEIVQLLTEATAFRPEERPDIQTFGARFVTSLR